MNKIPEHVREGLRLEEQHHNASYLGDGAYILHDQTTRQIVLYTENGYEVQDVVYLDYDCVKSLMGFLQRNGFAYAEK